MTDIVIPCIWLVHFWSHFNLQVEKEGENKVNVADLLVDMRQSRMGLIQTADQLYFSYCAIIEGIKHFNDPVSQQNDFNSSNGFAHYLRFLWFQTFGDYDEVPVISNEGDAEIEEASSPPLPPPRNQSLPKILKSESAHEFRQAETEKNAQNSPRNGHNEERPLPPLPPSRDNSLDPVNESGSDIDEGEYDEIVDVSTDEENDNDSDDSRPPPVERDIDTGTSESNLVNGNHDEPSFDADATLPPTPSNTLSAEIDSNSTSNSSHDTPPSPDSERYDDIDGKMKCNSIVSCYVCLYFVFSMSSALLRQRKRHDRNAEMKEKIKEIKRKQKACEEAAEAAPKKRRSIIIFSGVVVCALCCAYIYTKLGWIKFILFFFLLLLNSVLFFFNVVFHPFGIMEMPQIDCNLLWH